MNRILLDLDGVVLDWTAAVCEHLRIEGVRPIEPHHFTTYGLENVLSQREVASVERATLEGTLIRRRRWYAGAVAFVRQLSDVAPVVALSAGGPGGWNDTTKNYVAQGHIIGTIIFAPPGQKATFPGWTLIEDRADTATAWSRAQGRDAILIDRPWNRHDEIGPRVRRATSYAHAVSLVREVVR